MSKKTEEQTENEELWLHLFELHYRWYEGEHESTILATPKEQDEVEKDLKEAVSSVKIEEPLHDCLPEAYRRIIDILRQKGYAVCYFLSNREYYVREAGLIRRNKPRKYKIEHLIEKSEWKRLRFNKMSKY